MVWTHIKLSQAPLPMGCRYCGADQRTHCKRYVKSVGFHSWTEPTSAQRNARLRIYLEGLRNARESKL
jgi:hypothetical protein